MAPRASSTLSIYPEPPVDTVLVDSPSELEKQIGVARVQATNAINDAHAQVKGVINKWIGVEEAVETRVKSILSPDEPLTPSILYVGVGTLTGSILARSRALPIRVLLPPTLFFVTLSHFLPKTYDNLTSYISDLEHAYAPAVAEKHDIAVSHSAMGWEMLKARAVDARVTASNVVERGVVQVQDRTGLQIKEALGWGKAVAREGEGKVIEAVKAAQKQAEIAKVELDKKAVEAKVELEKKVDQASLKLDETITSVTSEPKKPEPKRLV